MHKKEEIENLKKIKSKLEYDLLIAVTTRDEFKSELRIVSNAKEKLEGRLFCDRTNARDI